MLHNSCQWNTMTTCRYKPTCFAGTGVLCILINWRRIQHYLFIEEQPKQVWLLLLCFVDNGSDLYSVGSILVLIIVSHRGQNIYLNMFWEFLCLLVRDFAAVLPPALTFEENADGTFSLLPEKCFPDDNVCTCLIWY